MRRLTLFLSTLLLALALPALAFAQDAAGAAAGLDLAPLAATVAAVAGLLVALSKSFPGWGTYINIAIGGLTAIAATLTQMGQESPRATVGAILIACVGAILGRARTKTRAAAG